MVLKHAGRVEFGQKPVPQVIDEYAQLGKYALPATIVTWLDHLEEATFCRLIAQIEE